MTLPNLSESDLRFDYPYGLVKVDGGYQYVNRENADLTVEVKNSRCGYCVFTLNDRQLNELEKLIPMESGGYYLYGDNNVPWLKKSNMKRYWSLLTKVRRITNYNF